MKSTIIWTTKKIEIFLSSVVLTRAELDVFNLLIGGTTYRDIADKHIWSEKELKEIISNLKAKYRVAQSENPDVLDPLPE